MIETLMTISPLWLVLPGLIILAFPLFLIIRHMLFAGKLRRVSRGEADETQLKPRDLTRYYRLVEKSLADPESALYKRSEIGEMWVARLKETGGTRWFDLIARHFPQDYLYPCFLHALKKSRLFKTFQGFLDDEDVLLHLETLGRSCLSRPFDGRRASQMLSDRRKQLRELAGSPNGDVRYFAFNILMHYEDSLSIGIVSGGFSDSHKPIRKILTEQAYLGTREEAYGKLEEILLNDPSRTIRLAAAKRINKEYRDLKQLDPAKMEREQILHTLLQWEEDSDSDERAAIALLESDDKNLTMEAARFLEKKGVLSRWFGELYRGDQDDFNRKTKLLDRAVSVNVIGFFDNKEAWEREGSLLGASRLLLGRGDLVWLEKLARTVFSRDPYGSDNSLDLYFSTLRAIDATGSDTCHQLKALELKKHQNDPILVEALLESLPEDREFYYRDDLFYLLEKGEPFCQILVRERLAAFRPSLILTSLYDMLLEEENSSPLRGHALMILCELHLDYTLQMVLEHLPLLSEEDLFLLPSKLGEFDSASLNRLAGVLFDSCDGEIHRSLLYALPLEDARAFTDRIRAFLGDRDWELRKAALIKLRAMGELTTSEGLPLLDDPSEYVRITAVSLLLDMNDKDILDVIGSLLRSGEEGENVKKAILEGLIWSDNPAALDLLFSFMKESGPLKVFILDILETRKDRFHMDNLARNYKECSPPIREELSRVVLALGLAMEEPLLELLRDQASQSREEIAALLVKAGYTEKLTSQLRSPHSDERIRVIEALVALGNREALKAALMGAGDPEKRVRIGVVRALEKLNTTGGNKLLEELKEDPDSKVRQYALWALERLAARS